MIKYTLENRPNFAYGDQVFVDCRCFGDDLLSRAKKGKIVGLSTKGLIDIWMVDFGEKFSEAYPYNVVAVQHTFIWNNEERKLIEKENLEKYLTESKV